MPNIVAYAVLYGYPLLAYFIFRSLTPARAVIWTILIGYLLLPPVPTVANFPILPTLSKIEIPSLSAALLLVWFHGLKSLCWPKNRILIALGMVYVLSPFATILLNSDVIVTGYFSVQPLSFRDIPSTILGKLFFLLPGILAYSVLSKPGHLKDILLALVIATGFYSVPMLLEIRLSPQINTWVYGFFQHDFAQMIRGSSFRPIVFLYHALWVAFLVLSTAIAATALYRYSDKDLPMEGGQRDFLIHPLVILAPFTRKNPHALYFWLALYFTVLLFLCRSYGSIIYGMALIPFAAMASPRLQLFGAFGLAVIVATYPITRMMGMFPTEELVDVARQINEARAHSLEFRFNNEQILLERAQERMLFGWGTWGRNMPINPFTGAYLTISDGRWIITLGQFGIVGFVAEFGLFLMPIVTAFYYNMKGGMAGISPYIPAFALLMGINAVDMLPNATVTPLTFLFVGAMMRHLDGVPERRAQQRRFVENRMVTYLPRPIEGPRTIL